MDRWLILSRAADILGVLAFLISVCTLLVARGIRKSMLAHVESSDYRKQIDQQISELEAYKKILLEENGSDISPKIFTKLAAMLEDIKIAYETILPRPVLRKISNLIEHIRNNLNLTTGHVTKQDIEKCISSLTYVVAELKKEKEML